MESRSGFLKWRGARALLMDALLTRIASLQIKIPAWRREPATPLTSPCHPTANSVPELMP